MSAVSVAPSTVIGEWLQPIVVSRHSLVPTADRSGQAYGDATRQGHMIDRDKLLATAGRTRAPRVTTDDRGVL